MDIFRITTYSNFAEELRDITRQARVNKATEAIPEIREKMRQVAQDGENEYYVSLGSFDSDTLKHYFEAQGFTVKVYSGYSLKIAW